MRGWIRAAFLAAFLIVCSVPAWGQASRFDGQVVNAQGRPVGGATIRVCTSAWTGTAASDCSPSASTFSDRALTVALGTTFTSDALGNFGFWAAAGRYFYQVSGPGITRYQVELILPCDPGIACGIPATGLALFGTAPGTKVTTTSLGADPTNNNCANWITGGKLSDAGIPCTGTPHNLLSSTHTDTLAASVAQGDILFGNATPAWARLAVGATNRVLASTGTQPNWVSSITQDAFISSVANPSVTGLFRGSDNQSICFRNNANTADICLTKGTNDSWNFSAGNLFPASGSSQSLGATSLPWSSLTVGSAAGTTQLITSSTGTRTVDFPNATGTLALTNLIQTWTASQNFTGGLQKAGSSVYAISDAYGTVPGAKVTTTDLGADPTNNNCAKWITGGKLGDLGSACGAAPAGAVGDVQYNSGASTLAAEPAFNYDSVLDKLIVPSLTITGKERIDSDITPSSLSADQNDYTPAGFTTASRVRQAATVAVNITGWSAGADGDSFTLDNVSSFNITLKDESTLSAAANRFALNADIILGTDQSITLRYDGTTTRWRAIGGLAGTGSGTVNSASQYSVAYYPNAGSTTVVGGLVAPTTPNDVAQVVTSTPSGGVATAPAFVLPGVPFNAQTGGTYTVVAADRGKLITHTSAAAVAYTLPQAGSTGFTNNFFVALTNLGDGLITITPTTSTINLATTLALARAQTAYIYSDNANYRAIIVSDIKTLWLPAATCIGGTTSRNWDDDPAQTEPTAVCVAGTNITKGVADFEDAGIRAMQLTLKLPDDFVTSKVDVRIKWFSAAISGDVVWQVATVCVADGETDDPAFNTASTVTDTTKGTASQTNDASINNLSIPGCVATELLHLRILRDPAHASDTLVATARLIGVELIYRTAQ